MSIAESVSTTDLANACPACRGKLDRTGSVLRCFGCAQSFPMVAGLVDLRLKSDRYLSLNAERSKAERLAKFEEKSDIFGLARAYYEMTFDVDDERRARFLAHLSRAERRGESVLRSLPLTGRILEIGCGTGGFLVAARRQGREVVGIDIASRWLVVARRRLKDRGLFAPLIAASAEALPFDRKSFDLVVLDSVIEHVENPARVFQEIDRVLRPGGSVIAWSPNRLSIARDPHVGLWGVGWLPKAWRRPYVKVRKGCEWTVEPLSPEEARRKGRETGWEKIEVGAPDVSLSCSESRWEGLTIALYRKFLRHSWTRPLLDRFGPLWEFRAIKRTAS